MQLKVALRGDRLLFRFEKVACPLFAALKNALWSPMHDICDPTNGTAGEDGTPSRVDHAPLFASLSVPRGLPTRQP
jgi:hypothetical protein